MDKFALLSICSSGISESDLLRQVDFLKGTIPSILVTFLQTYRFGAFMGLLNSDTFYGNHLMAGFLVTRGGGGFSACELTRVSHKNMVQMGTWHLKKHLVSHIRWWQCTSPGLIPEICQHHISIVEKM